MRFPLVGYCLLLMLGLALSGCEKKEAQYILKPEVGDTTVAHFDLMNDQPKYMRVRKSEYERVRAIEEQKKLRNKARNIYAKQSRWDP